MILSISALLCSLYSESLSVYGKVKNMTLGVFWVICVVMTNFNAFVFWQTKFFCDHHGQSCDSLQQRHSWGNASLDLPAAETQRRIQGGWPGVPCERWKEVHAITWETRLLLITWQGDLTVANSVWGLAAPQKLSFSAPLYLPACCLLCHVCASLGSYLIPCQVGGKKSFICFIFWW